MRMDEEHHDAHHEHHEQHHDYEFEHSRGSGIGRWVKGFMVGALVGWGASLLYAPRSGQETRELLRYKGTQLRQMASQVSSDAREKAHEVRVEAGVQATALAQRSREYVDQQKERVTRVADAVKTAAQENWSAEGAPVETPGPASMTGSRTY
jgi:gas vesicle protein